MTSPVIADAGNHINGVIVAFRGCAYTGNPWNATAGGVKSTASTAMSATAVTSTVDNCLIVNCVARHSDFAANQYSGEANAALSALTERIDNGTQLGNGGGIAVYHGVKAAAGGSGNTTATLANTSQEAYLTIALKPNDVDPPNSRIIYMPAVQRAATW